MYSYINTIQGAYTMSGKMKENAIFNDPAVKARLRTLLELAITIGRREGLIGNHSETTIKEEIKVTDKKNCRKPSASTTS